MGMNDNVKRVFFLLLIPFFCAFSIAKAEKIKYGKYIEYEGGVFKYQGEKLPFGKGTLSLLSYEKDSYPVIIEGDFQSRTQDESGRRLIRNATIRSNYPHFLSFKGTIYFSTSDDKKNQKLTLSLDGNVSHRHILLNSKSVSDLNVKKLVISYSFHNGKRAWELNVEEPICETTTFEMPSELSILGYKKYDVEKVIGFVSIGEDNHQNHQLTYNLKNGGTFAGNRLSFSDGSYFVVKNGKWSGTKKFADATITKSDNNDNFKVVYMNGDTYNGTLFSSDPHDIMAMSDVKQIRYKDGIFTSQGKTEKWINGESPTAIHNRLSGTLTPELLTAVEDGSLTEAEAMAKQKKLEVANKNECSYSVTIDQYRRVKFSHRTSDGSETMSGLYDLKKLSEADLSIMRKDEYVVAIDDLSSSAANIEFKGYDSNRGCLIFYSNDLRGFTRNINDKIYHFNACYDLRLSYPKSLVEIESYTDISGDKMYEQTLYSCKVDRNTAAEFQTSNVRLLVHFKFDRIKDDQIFGNATKMTLINLSTGASVDLTPSLKASNAAFKKVTNGYKPSSKKYHPEGRTVECWNCQGRGWNTRTGSSAHITCNICGGKGWKIEHEW